MKTFHEWLQEAAGIATNCKQFKQNSNTPNFAGSGSNLGCAPQEGSRKKSKNRKDEAGMVAGSGPANTKDYFTAGAPGKQEKMKPKKSKPKMD